jgi:hypothetical protein
MSLRGKTGCGGRGTSSDETGAERDGVRFTRAHNTLEVGRDDQGVVFAARHVGRRGRPRDVGATSLMKGSRSGSPVLWSRSEGPGARFRPCAHRPAVAAEIEATGVRLKGARECRRRLKKIA